VGLLPGTLEESNEPLLWMWTEFWNKSIARTYGLRGRSDGSGLPATPMTLDLKTGDLLTPREERYLVLAAVDPTLGIRGRLLHRSTYGAALIEPERPYRAAWALASQYGAAVAREHPLKLLVYPTHTPARERITLTLIAPATAHAPLTVSATAGSEHAVALLPPGHARMLSLAVEPAPNSPPVALWLHLAGQLARGRAGATSPIASSPSADLIGVQLASQ
jgi:hypothetical protein